MIHCVVYLKPVKDYILITKKIIHTESSLYFCKCWGMYVCVKYCFKRYTKYLIVIGSLDRKVEWNNFIHNVLFLLLKKLNQMWQNTVIFGWWIYGYSFCTWLDFKNYP